MRKTTILLSVILGLAFALTACGNSSKGMKVKSSNQMYRSNW